jgi:hypothetical protein
MAVRIIKTSIYIHRFKPGNVHALFQQTPRLTLCAPAVVVLLFITCPRRAFGPPQFPVVRWRHSRRRFS